MKRLQGFIQFQVIRITILLPDDQSHIGIFYPFCGRKLGTVLLLYTRCAENYILRNVLILYQMNNY